VKNKNEVHSSFERALSQRGKAEYRLRLYVTGMTPRSVTAIENIKQICESYLRGRYELEVIDVYQHPDLADQEQVIAAPALVKSLPLPLRRFIGDMSETEKILVGLNLMRKETSPMEAQPVPGKPEL